jgi:hypothetical protein
MDTLKMLAPEFYAIEAAEAAPRLFSDVLRKWGLKPRAPVWISFFQSQGAVLNHYARLRDPEENNALEPHEKIFHLKEIFGKIIKRVDKCPGLNLGNHMQAHNYDLMMQVMELMRNDDYESAYKLIRPEAEKGDGDFEHVLGVFYRMGSLLNKVLILLFIG